MQEIFKWKAKKPGLDPGTLVHVGARKQERVKITIIDYDEENFEERVAKSVEECFAFRAKPTVTWINVDGIHQVDVIEKIGNHYGFHPLLLEDILHTSQRPKVEDFYNYVYVVLKMLQMNPESGDIESEQVSLILGDNFVITFQETEGDIFDPIRERIRNSRGRIRKMGADYLAYALLDTIVDNYFVILESIGDEIESLEDELIENPDRKTLQKIHKHKRAMIVIRRSVWPLREVISSLQRGESSLFKQGTLIYLRDVYDHTVQVIDTAEAYRDIMAGMMDIYLSSISNRMNEIMKVLTIISTIFIPLTFIAGVYGMNFDYLPELNLRYGYFAILGVMATVAGVMLLYFRRKKWL